MALINAYEIPNLRFSMPAATDVERYRFVTVNPIGGVQASKANCRVIGVSMNKAKAGEVLEIADGLVMVEAAGSIPAGALVTTDDDGKAIITTATNNDAVAIAILNTNANSITTVKII